ncbi:RICIN domain-containing protein [Streptomyces sp. NPDC003077]|uniref:RICIN domain-containing protein n=1 Tax=Streptomyces sp. NPDC003077 TaxID=3154443 RepID=UPI0033A0A4B8
MEHRTARRATRRTSVLIATALLAASAATAAPAIAEEDPGGNAQQVETARHPNYAEPDEGAYEFSLAGDPTKNMIPYEWSEEDGAPVTAYGGNATGERSWDLVSARGKWTINDQAVAVYQIRSHTNGTLCVTVGKSVMGAELRQKTCDPSRGNQGQYWLFRKAGNGTYHLVPWKNYSLVVGPKETGVTESPLTLQGRSSTNRWNATRTDD